MRRHVGFLGFVVVCFIPVVVFHRHTLILFPNFGDDGDGGTTSLVDAAFTLPTVMTTYLSPKASEASASAPASAVDSNIGSDSDLMTAEMLLRNNQDASQNHEASNPKPDSHCKRSRPSDLPPFESLFDVGSTVEAGDNNNTAMAKRATGSNNYVDGLPRFRKNVDASDTLQFAVLGFPKAGTTAMRKALSNIALMAPGDYCPGRPEEIVHDMYYNKDIWKRAIERSIMSKSIPKLASLLQEGNGTILQKTGPFAIDEPVSRGVKCPRGLDTLSSLRFYTESFPSTKLLVGIRHPVTWFESFYNFRVQNFGQREDPYELTKSCVPIDDDNVIMGGNSNSTSSTTNTTAVYHRYIRAQSFLRITGNPRKCRSQSCPNDQLLCIDRARFHLFLSQLGKVPQLDYQLEADSSSSISNHVHGNSFLPSNRYMYETFQSKNPIFVYTMEQMSTSFAWNVSSTNASGTSSPNATSNAYEDSAKKRVGQFWRDISNFVNGDDGCGHQNNHDKLMIPTKQDAQNDNITSSYHVKPGKKLTDQQQQQRNRHKIDICDDKYNDIRIKLLHYGWQMSHYLCDNFIPHGNQVYASDVDYLCNTILKNYYQHDPCNKLRLVDADRGTYALR